MGCGFEFAELDVKGTNRGLDIGVGYWGLEYRRAYRSSNEMIEERNDD